MRWNEHCARVPRTDTAQSAFDAVDAEVVRIARGMGGYGMHYPALISRPLLERAGYPESFPHLLLTAARLDSSATAWCLSPAVCYHAYAQLAGRTLAAPVTLTARGVCFRDEEHTAPGVRQIEFEMREIVFVGPGEWVRGQSRAAADRVAALARGLGHAGEWLPAEDPFFLPAAAGKAAMQRLLGLKEEFRGPDGLALASINRHGTFFADRFGMRSANGDPVETACVAVGLDRWCAAAVAGTREKQEELCG